MYLARDSGCIELLDRANFSTVTLKIMNEACGIAIYIHEKHLLIEIELQSVSIYLALREYGMQVCEQTILFYVLYLEDKGILYLRSKSTPWTKNE